MVPNHVGLLGSRRIFVCSSTQLQLRIIRYKGATARLGHGGTIRLRLDLPHDIGDSIIGSGVLIMHTFSFRTFCIL